MKQRRRIYYSERQRALWRVAYAGSTIYAIDVSFAQSAEMDVKPN
jgi:hypothetical protein